MREILFRGKRKDNGEGVYGYYEFYNGGHYINVQTDRVNSGGYPIREFIEVIPETVGQYTGLTDKNGKKIFEGDFFRIDEDVKMTFKIYDGEVLYERGGFHIDTSNLLNSLNSIADIYGALRGEVIGNIHDNPNLLKESEDTE